MSTITKNSLCEVDEILDGRVVDNKIEYLVRWKKSESSDDDNDDHDDDDDDDSDTEWVPAELCSCPIAIANFEKSIGLWKDTYEVEGIIDSIEDPDGNVEYLVKWKGFDSSKQSTWVKEKDMHCSYSIQKFENGHPYRDRKMLQVKKIDDFAGFRRGVENYTIIKGGEQEATNKRYTLDQLYIAINGRKALCQFKGEFF